MDEVQQWIRSVKKIQNPINRRIVKKQLMDHPAYLNSRHPLHREVTDAVRACIEVEVAEHKPNDGLDEVRQRYGDKNRLTESQKRDLARTYPKGQFPDTIGPRLQEDLREIQAGMAAASKEALKNENHHGPEYFSFPGSKQLLLQPFENRRRPRPSDRRR